MGDSRALGSSPGNSGTVPGKSLTSSPATKPLVSNKGEDDDQLTLGDPLPPIPAWRQIRGELCRRSVLTFTLVYSFVMLMQNCLGAFLSTQITSVEREFGFSSLQSGQLMSSSQLGYITFLLPNSYLANRLHVPKVSAIVCIGVGFGGFLLGLPHFIFPHAPPQANTSTPTDAANIPPAVCLADMDFGRDDRCDAVSTPGSNFSTTTDGPSSEAVYSERAQPVLVYLCVIQVVRGALASVRFPMFTEYIERNAKKTDTGFYIGLLGALTTLGPGMSYLIGGAISKLHVSLQQTDMTPTHPDWVGAWWLGFLIIGGLATVSPGVLLFFPENLKGKEISEDTESTHQSNGQGSLQNNRLDAGTDASESRAEVEQLRGRGNRKSLKALCRQSLNVIKDFIRSVLKLCLNPAYFFLMVCTWFVGFALDGVYIFLPKYLQHQFYVPAWHANYIIGVAELTVGAVGLLVGGWLTRRLKLTVSGLYKTLLAATAIYIVLFASITFISCPQSDLIGAPGMERENATGNCSLNCACPDEVFPVCDQAANDNYFSPCHAGCATVEDGVYKNCSCTTSSEAQPGLCPSDCNAVYAFCTVAYLMLFIMSLSASADYLIVTRCVPDCQVGLAVGTLDFASTVVRLLVGPILFGDIIDSFCQFWNQPCGVKGECSVYDNDRFRLNLLTFSDISISLAFVAFLLSFLSYRYCRSCRRNSESTAPRAEEANRNENLLEDSGNRVV